MRALPIGVRAEGEEKAARRGDATASEDGFSRWVKVTGTARATNGLTFACATRMSMAEPSLGRGRTP
jgi:hypothetical protein